MDALEVIIIVVVVLLGVLALLGYVAVQRRRRATEDSFRAQMEQADHDLAAARASDRGWDPQTVETTARQAFAERFPGVEPAAVHLVQVLDLPGTDDDKAVFHVVAEGGEHRVTLGRRSGQWVPENVD